MPLESQVTRRWPLRWGLVLVAIALGAMVYASLDWYVAAPPDALANATYVGRQACIACHAAEVEAHAGSHHDRAMEIASPASVRGDFDNATLEYHGITTRFFRRGEQYFVNTEGPDGTYADFEVKYTFGVEPLQQYMVEFADGRVQVLRESWDTESKQWFYLPPHDATGVKLAPDDPAHWTGIGQNWNSTCAACHSTDLKKNYDLATDTYDTTFSEIDVSCEACHGPASLHVELAQSNSLFWDRRFGYGLHSLKSASNRPEIDTCAQCHARTFGQLADYRPGQPLDDAFHLALLDEGLYHADGQIEDEVFEVGSFLQSKMHSKGVRCSDCHDPHSTKLKFQGNALCTQCHIPAKYDTPAHHFHTLGTPGASCVECHMPATHYMMVDPRRDHSLRVPRPDLTVELGTPNACNNCHTKPEESAEWAAAAVERWYGPQRPDDPHWAPAFAAGRAGEPQGEQLLIKVWRRQQTPAIVRASALRLLSQYPTSAVAQVFRQALREGDPLIRRSAVESLPIAAMDVHSWLAPLLDDPSRGVRVAVARRYVDVPRQQLDAAQHQQLERAMADYRVFLNRSPELIETHLQLAHLALSERDLAAGSRELRTAIRLAPYRAGPRGELAMLLEATDGDPVEIERLRREEIPLLERDLELLPEDVELRSTLGGLHYLLGELEQAERRLTEAAELAPRHEPFLLALAEVRLLLYRQSPDEEIYRKGLEVLQMLREIDPEHPSGAAIYQQFRAARQAAEAPSP